MRAAILTILALTIAFPGFAGPDNDAWTKIANDSFSFSLPAAFKKTAQRGIDSFVEEYVTDDLKISFDYGIYSNNFDDWPKETKYETVKVDGRSAKIGTVMHEFQKGFPYSTQIHMQSEGSVTLSMFAACKSEKEVALAKKIFQTIKFTEKAP